MAPTEDEEIDQAWDSLSPAPVSGVNATGSSRPPAVEQAATDEVDSGWDDLPESVPQPPGGKRRRHRERRAKTGAVVTSANPVLLPRPAEPTKKQQREQARKARAHEALAKQRNKEERKAQRAAEAREQAEARLRQTEAEARARQMRREARERADSDRPSPKRVDSVAKTARKAMKRADPGATSVKRTHAESRAPSSGASRRSSLRPGVLIILLILALAIGALLLRK